MKTYFAPAERADNEQFQYELKLVCENPLISGLLNTVGGVLAVLNNHRQIVSVNNDFLKMLGFDDPEKSLGLRPGEVLDCNYSSLEEGGCGTSKYCSTCGAALAIVSALNNEVPEKRICVLSCKHDDKDIDVALLVRAQPLKINNIKLVLLFLQDITIQQQRAALERTFFHDIRNILSGIMGASEILSTTENRERQLSLSRMIHNSALRMNKEVEIQRYLLVNDAINYTPIYDQVNYSDFIQELHSYIAGHPSADTKKLTFDPPEKEITFRTDISLLIRIITNMLTNALEATDQGGEVRLWVEEEKEKEKDILRFYVWNKRAIPEEIKLRIFQRNFSTKDGDGRGIGTYSMKLFGEKILCGDISFTSSEEEGTVFCFSIPVDRYKGM
ncbi:MAG: HAMP domain-containing histidine kinase [Spirochaetales bacterium]|nr:HAMP domain-containing histidine kinase [Spirochaetales bacterium]